MAWEVTFCIYNMNAVAVCRVKTARGIEKETHIRKVQTIQFTMNVNPCSTPHKFPQNYTRQTKLNNHKTEVHRLQLHTKPAKNKYTHT